MQNSSVAFPPERVQRMGNRLLFPLLILNLRPWQKEFKKSQNLPRKDEQTLLSWINTRQRVSRLVWTWPGAQKRACRGQTWSSAILWMGRVMRGTGRSELLGKRCSQAHGFLPQKLSPPGHVDLVGRELHMWWNLGYLVQRLIMAFWLSDVMKAKFKTRTSC